MKVSDAHIEKVHMCICNSVIYLYRVLRIPHTLNGYMCICNMLLYLFRVLRRYNLMAGPLVTGIDYSCLMEYTINLV